MKIIVWNCRGAGNDAFKNSMRDLYDEHKHDIVILIETKVPLSNMGTFFCQFGLVESAHVDPVGKSGGLWLLWNPATVTVKNPCINSQVVYAVVTKIGCFLLFMRALTQICVSIFGTPSLPLHKAPPSLG